MTIQVVVGAGEVGTALAQVLGDAHLRDTEPAGPVTADVLHIAYPYTPVFVDVTAAYQRIYDAGLVIVHSTVPVDTCDRRGWVHSPVRGRHPDLVDGLKTFVKWFGGRYATTAAELFDAVNVPTATTDLAATTEAGKLWELVQFGVQVRVAQAVYEWCDEHAVDADVVYRGFAESYNEGYRQLGEGRFARPVLEHVPGPIGGHCVAAGASMLGHPLGDLVTDAP